MSEEWILTRVVSLSHEGNTQQNTVTISSTKKERFELTTVTQDLDTAERYTYTRRYRADDLSELLEISVTETRLDRVVNSSNLIQSIRDAIFDAEDR